MSPHVRGKDGKMQPGPHGICTIKGCGKELAGRGLCMKHYMRWRKHGDPLKVIQPKKKPRPLCSIKGCTAIVALHSARGLCYMHYQRWRKSGNPGESKRRRAHNGQGTVTVLGYRFRHTRGLEHREIMERAIGRKLKTDEVVHHKNGDKLDNRLGNLALMSRSEHMKLHENGKETRFKKRKIPC